MSVTRARLLEPAYRGGCGRTGIRYTFRQATDFHCRRHVLLPPVSIDVMCALSPYDTATGIAIG